MRKLFSVCYAAALFVLLAAAQDTPRPATNREVLAKGKVFFVKSDTFFVKKEEMEKGLLKNEDLDRLGVQVTENENEANFVLKVKRAAFQNNFPYTVTDRYSGRIIAAGEPKPPAPTMIAWASIKRCCASMPISSTRIWRE